MISRDACRRAMLRLAVLCAVLPWPSPAAAQEIRVTLLGTGAPPPIIDRFGPSILVEAAGERLVFDAGRGAVQRLAQAGVPLGEVRKVFLTHLHSDHVVGFPDLWLTAWLIGRPEVPLEVWGPVGTQAMVTHLEQAFAFDIKVRLGEDRPPARGIEVTAHETSGGVVYERDGLKVSAFRVDHMPDAPAFGYKVEYAGRSVVLSGDTRVSDELVRQAGGADLLIHEVAAPLALARAGFTPDRAARIVAHHVTPEQAADVFTRARPRLAVFSHVVPPAATEADLIPPTRARYAGRLELGEDLMVIEIGKDVTVRRPGR